MKAPDWILRLPWNIIRDTCESMRLDPWIIGALIKAESNGNQFACRFEPAWRYHWNVDHFAEKAGSSHQTETMCQATSWGYMQIMGTVAREQGYFDFLPGLCDEAVNIHHGCKHFRKRLEQSDKIEDAVAMYNAGKVRLTEGGLYRNQSYVDKVMRHYRQIARLRTETDDD